MGFFTFNQVATGRIDTVRYTELAPTHAYNEPEIVIRNRILAVVDYLYRIQQK